MKNNKKLANFLSLSLLCVSAAMTTASASEQVTSVCDGHLKYACDPVRDSFKPSPRPIAAPCKPTLCDTTQPVNPHAKKLIEFDEIFRPANPACKPGFCETTQPVNPYTMVNPDLCVLHCGPFDVGTPPTFPEFPIDIFAGMKNWPPAYFTQPIERPPLA